MTKKMSLNDLKEKVLKPDELKAVLTQNPEVMEFLKGKTEGKTVTPIIYSNFYDEGKDQTIFYCHSCGHSWTKDSTCSYNDYAFTPYWRRMKGPETAKCPHCGKELPAYKPNKAIKDLELFTFVRECDKEAGYVLLDTIFATVSHHYESLDGKPLAYDGENIDFLKGELRVEIINCCEALISMKFGVRPYAGMKNISYSNFKYYGYTSLCSPNSNEYKDSIARLLTTECLVGGAYDNAVEMLKEAGANGDSFNQVLDSFAKNYDENKKSSTKTKTKVDVDPMSLVEFEDLDVNEVMERFRSRSVNPLRGIRIIYSQMAGVTKCVNACACGEIFETTETDQHGVDSVICPKCKNELSGRRYKPNHTSYEKASFAKYELSPETGAIVVRAFDITMDFDYETKNISFGISEKYRIFFMEKQVKMYYCDGNSKQWKKDRVTSLDYIPRNLACYNTKEELIDIIKSSVFKYSGLLDAKGLGINPAFQIEELSTISRCSYIYNYTKMPFLEQLIKTGLTNIVKDIIKDNSLVEQLNTHGSTVYDILGINRTVFKMAKEKNVSLKQLNVMKRLYNLEESLTIEEYDAIMEIDMLDRVIQLKERFGISFKKTLEYINSCYNNQCIEKREAINIWYDYLRMAKDMEYRLKDNTIKYPASLKKEHDRAIFSYRVAQDEMNKKHFAENSERNAELYNYENGDYLIKVPMTPNEVIQEGTVQKHCVASYVSRITEDSTAICFARRKADPDTAYYTIEVNNGRVIQVKGYCNCAPQSEEFIDFLRKWAKAKNLQLRY